jgi:hypothetical protein
MIRLGADKTTNRVSIGSRSMDFSLQHVLTGYGTHTDPFARDRDDFFLAIKGHRKRWVGFETVITKKVLEEFTCVAS